MIYFLTVNYYATDLIEKLIGSIQPSQERNFQILIVNNSPDDRDIGCLKNSSTFILEAGENLGFGRACNLGLSWVYRQDPNALVWLINPDAYLLENAGKIALDFFVTYPEISILGTVVYKPNGQVWFAGGQFIPQQGLILETTVLSPELETVPYLEMNWVTGCSLLINLKNFKECPLFNPDYFLYYEDFDFCQRYAKQGHKIGLTNRFFAIHEPSSITGRNGDLKSQHTIYSYLLSLEKHTSRSVLHYRLWRITLAALLSMPFNSRMALNKLKGVLMYVRR